MGPLPLIVIRPPAVYGPRDREIFPLFRLASRGILPVFNPRSRLSLIHYSDLVRGVAGAAEKGRIGEIYCLAHPTPVNACDLPRLFENVLGRRVRSFNVPVALLKGTASLSEMWGRLTGKMPVFNREKVRELTAPSWLCEWEKAKRDFAFTARVDLAEGLKETFDWYREQKWL